MQERASVEDRKIKLLSVPGKAVKPEEIQPSRNPGCGTCHGKGVKWNKKLCECAMRRFLKAYHEAVEMGEDPDRPGERTLLWKARAIL